MKKSIEILLKDLKHRWEDYSKAEVFRYVGEKTLKQIEVISKIYKDELENRRIKSNKIISDINWKLCELNIPDLIKLRFQLY